MKDQAEFEAAIARVRLEFSASLPARLQAMRDARLSLSTGYDPDAAETFFLQAHSLKGTAGAFEAIELEVHARVLTDLGKRWRGARAASNEELEQAEEAIDRLAEAVERYRRKVEGGENVE